MAKVGRWIKPIQSTTPSTIRDGKSRGGPEKSNRTLKRMEELLEILEKPLVIKDYGE